MHICLSCRLPQVQAYRQTSVANDRSWLEVNAMLVSKGHIWQLQGAGVAKSELKIQLQAILQTVQPALHLAQLWRRDARRLPTASRTQPRTLASRPLCSLGLACVVH